MPIDLITTRPEQKNIQLPTQLNFFQFLLFDIILLSLILCIAFVIGYATQSIGLSLFIGCCIFFAFQLFSIITFQRWINTQNYHTLPQLHGILKFIAHNVQHTQLIQHQKQQKMYELIAQAQDSLKNLSEGIVIIDEQDIIIWGNLTAVDLLAIDQPDINKPIQSILTDNAFIEYLQNPDFSPDGIKILSPDYQNRFVQIKITNFSEDYRLLIAYDVTRIHNLEQIRKDFVDNVSHELRTPLTVLSGYIETFKDQEDLPPRWERAFNQMQAQTKRMTALVNDLLLLSNLENNKSIVKHHLIDIADLMNRIFDDAQGYNVDFGHTLNLDIDSHYDLFGAENEVASAFNNLITNAIKYTPKGGTITISWHDYENGAYFSVQDTGIGISAEHLPRLTERFYRVDTARSRSTGGTGLGLAIVKHVLLQHDAHLEISSEEGQGSLFKVVFPKSRLFTTREPSDEFVDN